LIDRRLYLPTSWTDDRECCRRAGVEDTIGFETKVAMAKAMVRRAIAERIPFGWVTTDAAYGYSKGGRFELEQADVFHVMANTRHDTVVTRWSIDHPVHELFPGCCGRSGSAVPAVKEPTVGRSSTGPVSRLRPWHREGRRHWILARRSVSRPEEISYYIAYCPADATLDELIRITGSRWAVEECFQTAKQECGLDDYQVRRYAGWLAAPHDPRHGRPRPPDHPAGPRAGHGQSRNGSSQLIHLSLAEIRRLITHLTDRRPTAVHHTLHSSTWRRRRQHQARISHYKRRRNGP
jgi:hypothetical protein